MPNYPGLRLIAADFLEVKPDTEPRNRWFDKIVSISVPTTTQRVCVLLNSWDMTFGTRSNRKKSELTSARFILTEYNYSKVESEGVFEFRLQAVLQNRPDPENTGDWSGTFVVEFLCFGK